MQYTYNNTAEPPPAFSLGQCSPHEIRNQIPSFPSTHVSHFMESQYGSETVPFSSETLESPLMIELDSSRLEKI